MVHCVSGYARNILSIDTMKAPSVEAAIGQTMDVILKGVAHRYFQPNGNHNLRVSPFIQDVFVSSHMAMSPRPSRESWETNDWVAHQVPRLLLLGQGDGGIPGGPAVEGEGAAVYKVHL